MVKIPTYPGSYRGYPCLKPRVEQGRTYERVYVTDIAAPEFHTRLHST